MIYKLILIYIYYKYIIKKLIKIHILDINIILLNLNNV